MTTAANLAHALVDSLPCATFLQSWFYDADPKSQRYTFAINYYGLARELNVEEHDTMPKTPQPA